MADDTVRARAVPAPGSQATPSAAVPASSPVGADPSRDYSHKPWYNDQDAARETAAKFFGYSSWQDAFEAGGAHGAKIAEKLAETLREFAAHATDRVFDAELRTDAADDMVFALQRAIDEHFGPENERLRTALASLERAAAAVYKAGARTGPQWLPLGASLACARAVMGAARVTPLPDDYQRGVTLRMVDSEKVARLIERQEIAPIIKQRLIAGLIDLRRDSDGSPKGGDAEGGSVHDSAVPSGNRPETGI